MDKEVEVLLKAIKAAGAAILQLQKTDYEVARKANNDLVTQGDILANDILKTALLTAFPGDGWLSEETIDDAKRLNDKRVWVVDPIDGTIEFARGIPEYAISVALVECGVPIVAAVFNPATDELFHAVKGKGAWRNNIKIHCDETAASDFLFLASRSEYKRGEWSEFEKIHRVKVVGSIAYKLALVAAGYAHATFSLGPKNEWDIAAGILLVLEAGGKVTDKNRNSFLFNQKKVLVDGVVASAANMNEKLFDMLNEKSHAK